MAEKRLWQVEYLAPDGKVYPTVILGEDEAHVRYTFARYFPKVTVVTVRPEDQEDK